MAKGKASEAQATIAAQSSQPYQFDMKEGEKAVTAFCSQLLQRVNNQNAKIIDDVVAKLKDEQEIELERIKRHCEQDVTTKMRQEVYSQIMAQIKRSSMLEWNDELQAAIMLTVSENIDDAVDLKLQKLVLTERRLNELALTKIRETSKDTNKRIDNLARKTFERLIGAVSSKIQQKLSAERNSIDLALTKIREVCKASNKRIDDMQRKNAGLNRVVTESLAAIDEVTKAGVATLQTAIAQQIVKVEQETIARIDESQHALAIQIESLTLLWTEMDQLRSEVYKLSTPGRNEGALGDGHSLDNLMAFDEELLIDMESLQKFPSDAKPLNGLGDLLGLPVPNNELEPRKLHMVEGEQAPWLLFPPPGRQETPYPGRRDDRAALSTLKGKE